MNDIDMNNPSETNWAMIESLTDETMDRSDLPPLDDSFFARAIWRMPVRSVAVTLQVDQDTLAWFEAQGEEWEERMTIALRIYADAHREFHRRPVTA